MEVWRFLYTPAMPFALVQSPRGRVLFVKCSPLGYSQFHCTHLLAAVSGPFDVGDEQNEGTHEFCPPATKKISNKCVQRKTIRQRTIRPPVYIILQNKFDLITQDTDRRGLVASLVRCHVNGFLSFEGTMGQTIGTMPLAARSVATVVL